MEHLNMQDLENIIKQLKTCGYKLSDIPVYLGNDDELNGIHTAWCVDLVDKNDNDENNKMLVEMIVEDCHNVELKDKAIVIS